MGSFTSSLGKDKLVVTRFEGSEALSELFEYRLEVVSDDNDVDFDKILGTKCGLEIQSHHEGVKRNFSGVLVEAQWVGRDQDLRYYRLVLRPWFWLLTRTTNCKIYSHKTVPDILSEVLGNRGFVQFEKRLSESYPELEYCVQYRESDFAFMSRLMEEYGIYYYFEHSDSDHKLILVDSSSAHEPKLGGAALEFSAVGLDNITAKDRLNEWAEGRRLRSGKVTLEDYDYEKPSTDLLAEKTASAKYQHGDLELYDYPGRYTEKGEGTTLANVRLEAEQAIDKRVIAGGDAVTCCPGFTITLDGTPPASKGTKYLILRANHLFRSQAYRSANATGDEGYSGNYEFQPIDIPFRAPATTRKPVIYGPQTAKVVSDVDDQCRIEVQFYWDRDKVHSRYVRIAQSWAGNGWGDVKIPRIDMEVVVEYLEGDPDYPLVTGSVYNKDNVAPYVKDKLNAVSGTKTQTLKGSGYNELIMDDTAGDELIRFHAQHDLEGKVENDERRDIGQNVKVTIGNNRDESIMSTWTVKANEKIEFTVGQSTFTMDPVSIKLKSTMITLEADALVNIKSNALGQVTASAPLIIQGGLVLIN
ncbi:type VI secretion system Vgr family protein [Labrys okinawensis]|uniref:type VI secretion system Vgr family protein n=1 Tax=Labrys okinawensis TaxID=346911 RepID=UPI0039BD7690